MRTGFSTTVRAVAGSLAALVAATCAAAAQDTVKIGLIMPYSGPLADTGTQMDGGIRLFLQKYGDQVAGRKIEVIRKDVGGPAPDVAKRLAQELVVRDHADILAGLVLTPNALAVADVSAQAKKLMVIMNAGTSIITTKSPYSTRTAVTLPQAAGAMATWAKKSGINDVYTLVADYGPGYDSEGEFSRSFKELGGNIVAAARFPVATVDFSSFIQRVKDVNPQSLFVFMPAGPQPAAFGKALVERGVSPKTTRIIEIGDLTSDAALKALGEDGLGIVSAWNYDANQDGALNKEFVKLYVEANHRNPDFMSVGAWDGMHLIYEALKKTGGKADGDALIAAVKGMSWESPRGPMAIDPQTRDAIENIYIRRVEMVDGQPRNVVIDTIPDVRDPVLARMPK